MKPKPPCPTCADASRVKTQGGGSKKLYRYTCEKSDCHTEWQQIPPHKLEGEIAKIILKTTGRRANQYKCGICGAKKKGHKCKVAEEDGDGDDSAMATLSVVAVGEGTESGDEFQADSMPPLALFQHPAPFLDHMIHTSSRLS